MTEQKIWIPFPLPGLNEIIGEARKNRFASAKQKKTYTDSLVLICSQLKPCLAANFEFIWVCKDKRKDPDNLTAGQKYFFDALVKAKIFKNDGWKEVKSIKHRFEIGDRPGVLVFIEEV